jgi:hypothetical protein
MKGWLAPVLILGFFHHEKNPSDTINLTMKWPSPSHLDVSYDGRAASLDFQAIKCGGVEISVHDLSGELTRVKIHSSQFPKIRLELNRGAVWGGATGVFHR